MDKINTNKILKEEISKAWRYYGSTIETSNLNENEWERIKLTVREKILNQIEINEMEKRYFLTKRLY